MLRTICLLMLLLASATSAEESKPKITFIAGEWPAYTNSDGTGTYWQIIKHIYQDEFELSLTTSSWRRANNLVKAGKVDALVGIFTQEKGGLIIPHHHIDTEYAILALFDSKRHQIKDANDLAHLTIAGRSNYGFEHFIPKNINYYGVDSINDTHKLVLNKRVDAVLVSAYNRKFADPEGSLDFVTVIPAQKLFIGFRNNEKGNKLRQIFDQKMAQMLKADEVRQYFPSREAFKHAKLGQIN